MRGGNKSVDFSTLRRQNFMDSFDGGFQELSIKVNGEDAEIYMVGTHVRINLDAPLDTGESNRVYLICKTLCLGLKTILFLMTSSTHSD